jgi:uridine kinase
MRATHSFVALAEHLRTLPSAHETLLMGIDGLGGSGKSTFAKAIAKALAEIDLPPCVVELDDFFNPGEGGWGFDHARLRQQVLEPITSGTPARYQRYDWRLREPGDWVELPKCDVLVVEGVSACHPSVADFFDHMVYVEAPREVRLERGISRDGMIHQEKWERVWMPAEERYVAQHRPQERADLIVDGSGKHRCDLMRDFWVL